MSDSPQDGSVWVVVADDPTVGSLVEAARRLGEEVVVLVAGTRAVAEAVAGSGVDRVVWLGEPAPGTPLEAYGPDVARLVAEARPRAVVAAATSTGRALLGAVAGRCGAPVLAAESVRLDGAWVVVDRLAHGGIARRTETVDRAPVLFTLAPESAGDTADTAAGAGDAAAAPIEEVQAQPLDGVTVVDLRRTEQQGVSIGAASTVVGIGRGLKAREDLGIVEDLAAALGGELACSRPLAEGVDWVAKERYIGISGQHIAPDLYIAAGISGQLQHMVGVRDAKVVVAINSDASAPIFGACDLGIVGDLYTLLPALTAAVRDARQ